MSQNDIPVNPDERLERIERAHQRTLRECLWLPREERFKHCSRCTLVKKSILTLQLRKDRFGICARCLETLWSEVGNDD
jgi:hypothetical protein